MSWNRKSSSSLPPSLPRGVLYSYTGRTRQREYCKSLFCFFVWFYIALRHSNKLGVSWTFGLTAVLTPPLPSPRHTHTIAIHHVAPAHSPCALVLGPALVEAGPRSNASLHGRGLTPDRDPRTEGTQPGSGTRTPHTHAHAHASRGEEQPLVPVGARE